MKFFYRTYECISPIQNCRILSKLKNLRFKTTYKDACENEEKENQKGEGVSRYAKDKTQNEKVAQKFNPADDDSQNIFNQYPHWLRKIEEDESDPTFGGCYHNHRMYHKYSYYDVYSDLTEKRNPQPSIVLAHAIATQKTAATIPPPKPALPPRTPEIPPPTAKKQKIPKSSEDSE